MSQAEVSGLPTDQIQKHRDDLEDLAESDLPAAKYADLLLELLEDEGQNQ